jgi:hypothetical protein
MRDMHSIHQPNLQIFYEDWTTSNRIFEL